MADVDVSGMLAVYIIYIFSQFVDIVLYFDDISLTAKLPVSKPSIKTVIFTQGIMLITLEHEYFRKNP